MTKVSEITSKAIADMIEYYKPVGGKIQEIENDIASFSGKLKLSTMLDKGLVTKIKIVSDSFGVGVGTTGGGADPLGTLIGTTGAREGLKNTPCWVNYFRNFINKKYPAVEFFNASIGGYSIKEQGLALGTGWYGIGNDVVLVMLGANDRGDVTSEADFKQAATQFLANVQATCNYLIVCSQNIPLNEYNADGTLNGIAISTQQVDKILAEICKEKGYTFISMYNNIKDHIQRSGITPAMLVRTVKETEGIDDNLHPNNEGSLLMWEILQKELGLLEDSSQILTRTVSSSPQYALDRYVSGSLNNPITDYKKGSTTIVYVPNPTAQSEGFPGGYAGILTTFRHIYESYFHYQEFYCMQGTVIARRYWTGNAWSDWALFEPKSGVAFTWKAISGSTPDVSSGNSFKMTNSAPTNVTNLVASGYSTKTIIFGDGNSTLVQGLFKLKDGVNWTPTLYSSITLYKSDLTAAWAEMSRTQI